MYIAEGPSEACPGPMARKELLVPDWLRETHLERCSRVGGEVGLAPSPVQHYISAGGRHALGCCCCTPSLPRRYYYSGRRGLLLAKNQERRSFGVSQDQEVHLVRGAAHLVAPQKPHEASERLERPKNISDDLAEIQLSPPLPFAVT